MNKTINRNTRLNQIPGIAQMTVAQLFTLAAQAHSAPNDRAELQRYRAQKRETEQQELQRYRAQAKENERLQVLALTEQAKREAREWVQISGGK